MEGREKGKYKNGNKINKNIMEENEASKKIMK
jgi:hypothetical protein